MPLYRTIDELLKTPEAQAFLRGLRENPDPLSRMQFADFLAENGFEAAGQGQRWAAKYGKRPLPPHPDPTNALSGWLVAGDQATEPDAPSYLPHHFFTVDPLTGMHDEQPTTGSRRYSNVQNSRLWQAGRGGITGTDYDPEHEYIRHTSALKWNDDPEDPQHEIPKREPTGIAPNYSV